MIELFQIYWQTIDWSIELGIQSMKDKKFLTILLSGLLTF
jgi:radical SAM superfamily enzyme